MGEDQKRQAGGDPPPQEPNRDRTTPPARSGERFDGGTDEDEDAGAGFGEGDDAAKVRGRGPG